MDKARHTEATFLLELIFDGLTGGSITMADTTAVLLGTGVDDPVTTHLLADARDAHVPGTRPAWGAVYHHVLHHH